MCTKQSIKEETKNENPCSHNILVFHIAKTSWKVKEIRTCDKSMPIRHHYSRYCISPSNVCTCTCLLVWIDHFPRRGLWYPRRAAAWQAIMDGQCLIDTARLEIMARTRRATMGTFFEWATKSNLAGEPTRREFLPSSVYFGSRDRFPVSDLTN